MNDKLKLLRIQRDLTQAQVAEDLNISQATYARIESGQIKLTMDRLEEIAHYFEVDSNYFLSKQKIHLDHDVQSITNQFLEKIVNDNVHLRQGRIKQLEEEIRYLRKQNQMLLEKLNDRESLED